jgi:uncharacterized protein (TIGR01244 family)
MRTSPDAASDHDAWALNRGAAKMHWTHTEAIDMKHLILSIALVCGAAACSRQDSTTHATTAKAPPKTEVLEPYSCGTVQRLHTFDKIFVGSQPAADDLKHAKENGIKTIVNLRMPDELKEFDEPALVKELGMQYVSYPFNSPDNLTDAMIDGARHVLSDANTKPLFMHCHSGNRAGAIWLAWRVLDGGLAWDKALDEAHEVGLKTPAFETRVKDYVERCKAIHS